VLDNGVLVDTLTGVDRNIRVDIDEDGAADNNVALDLGTQEIRGVSVDLGDGNNTFTLAGGTVGRSLNYRGGEGNDAVTIAAAAAVDGSVYAQLGAGDDTVLVEGNIGRNLYVRAGGGDDTIDVVAGAVVDGNVDLRLGDGTNHVTVGGEI